NLFDELFASLGVQFRIALEFGSLIPGDRMMTNWLRKLIQSDEVKQLTLSAGDQVLGGQQVITTLLSMQILRAQARGYKIVSLPRIFRARLQQRYEQNQFQLPNSLDRILDYIELRTAGAELALENAQFRGELTSLAEFCKSLVNQGRTAIGAKHAMRLASVLHRLGRFHDVHPLLDTFLANGVVEQLDSKAVGVLMSNKAVTLVAQGKPADARRVLQQTIEIDQQRLPADHPTLATHYSNLAGILKTLGELDESRRYIQQAIAIEEKHFGKDHHTLGLRHWWLGDIELAASCEAEAEAEFRRAHEILSQHCPADHPHLAKLNQAIEQLNDDTEFTVHISAPSATDELLPLPDDVS
ncbi:MAG: tetratricopeptide repeat protein, partial [Pirellulaceae bacterium]|nr:tetratricopeptide repeat protein [Pirellulaceae bacterium]